MSTKKTSPAAAAAPSVFEARALIKAYLDTHQENLGTTILAESENMSLVGFAADNIEAFCGKLANILTKTGAVGENFAKTFNPLCNGFASQFRFVGFVSENGTVQLDGQHIALSLPYTEKQEDGSLVAKVRTTRYPLLRGFAGDLSALPGFFISKEKDKEAFVKPDYVYNDNLKPQAVSFWAETVGFDVETLTATIPDLAPLAALPGFELLPSTSPSATSISAKIPLDSVEAIQAYKALLDDLPENSAVRIAIEGVRLLDESDKSFKPVKSWQAALGQKPQVFQLFIMQGEISISLPESMALPEWQRQDI